MEKNPVTENDTCKLALFCDAGSILLGDAMHVLASLPSSSVPLILTDIPYGVVNRDSAGIRIFDKKDADEVENFTIGDLVCELDRVSSGSIYVFCSTEQVSDLRASFAGRGLTTRLGIWEKTNPSPVNGQHMWLSGIETCVFARKKGAAFNLHCKNTVWRFPNGRSKRHPTEKPLKLFEYLITASSRSGDMVLDPFAGSGTTAEAALRTGRRFLCVDKSPHYVEVMKDRMVEKLQGTEHMASLKTGNISALVGLDDVRLQNPSVKGNSCGKL